ncbi:hypothetical protein [Consotaella salsifontis]|uniref:Uncharacterized protein n=1 Tax=Consotaella salsifontis TaxID=1365950 RepID=A0A1T4MKX5_9HYPH|nr:hypothetical protein [Consotaella salsifontis]SJZ67689.1 hypothetical protein SAMN05428963_102174 [Consotaella salsifontis]
MTRFLDVAVDIADLLFEAEETRRPLDIQVEAQRLVTLHAKSGVSLDAVLETLKSEYTIPVSASH